MMAVGAVAFSGKAVIIKLAYRYGVDALTLLALRMAFSAPLFLALGVWAARSETAAPLGARDAIAIVILGIVGYYLASYFDFLGLQYITAALERLVLYLYPTFVVLLSAALFGRRIVIFSAVAAVHAHQPLRHDADDGGENQEVGDPEVEQTRHLGPGLLPVQIAQQPCGPADRRPVHAL